VQRFRVGLVFKAHELLYHSTLGLRVIIIKKNDLKNGSSWQWWYQTVSGRRGAWAVVHNFRVRASGFEFRVSGFEFRVSGFEFRVSVVEFQVSGCEFRVSGSRFRQFGFGFQVSYRFVWFRVSGFI